MSTAYLDLGALRTLREGAVAVGVDCRMALCRKMVENDVEVDVIALG